MYHIAEVEINGFWGKFDIKTDLFKGVNIFIGKNGTGKTTFINILQAVLTVDLKFLASLPFNEVKIKLLSDGHRRSLNVTRIESKDSPLRIKYRISGKPFELPIATKERRSYYYRHRLGYLKLFEELKQEIDALVNISWLSVQRELLEEKPVVEHEYGERYFEIDPIEHRLKGLMKKLTEYRLTLEGKAGDRSDKFLRDVLVSTLYDKDLDMIELEYILKQVDLKRGLKKEKDDLIKAYVDLGVQHKVAQEKVENHIKVLIKCIKGVRNDWKKKGKTISFNNVPPLPLIKRTQHIIKLSQKAKADQKIIFEPLQRFLSVLQSFIIDKRFKLDPSGLAIFKKDRRLTVEQLSSGEKQLLIFLTETLLQRGQPFIYIADEPELSLHIEWQKKLIPSIRELNGNAQIIVATHAPTIASNHPNNIIAMEEIVHD